MNDSFYRRYMMLIDLYDKQVEVANLSGLSPQVVSAIKKKKIENPTMEVLKPLGAKLGVSIDWLLIGRGNAFPPSHPSYSKLRYRAKEQGYLEEMFPENPVNITTVQDELFSGNLSQDEFAELLHTLREMITSWLTMYEAKSK